MPDIGNSYGGERRRFSLALLVLANLLPLAGVILFDWDVGYLMVLYWSENLVIGFYTLLRIILSSGLQNLVLGPFFLVHYGGFCFGHGVFIQALLFQDAPVPDVVSHWPFALALGALFASHGASFVVNFLRGGERERLTAREHMSAPYGRIVILHVAILVGGVGVSALGQPVFMLLALVVLKIVIDIKLHQREHDKVAGRSPAAVEDTGAAAGQ
ncbi:MAG: DUF6498-containing protein [Halioglobus sp.]|nr:DUF6498-containing protein [Halioglobus sp.]